MRRRFKGASVDATEAAGEVAATEAGEGPERWTSGRKADVVLRLLRGEDVATVAREIGVPAHRATENAPRPWKRGSRRNDRHGEIESDVGDGRDAFLYAPGWLVLVLWRDRPRLGQVVGHHVAKIDDRFAALEPIKQGITENFGGYASAIAAGLKLRLGLGHSIHLARLRRRDALARNRTLPRLRRRAAVQRRGRALHADREGGMPLALRLRGPRAGLGLKSLTSLIFTTTSGSSSALPTGHRPSRTESCFRRRRD